MQMIITSLDRILKELLNLRLFNLVCSKLLKWVVSLWKKNKELSEAFKKKVVDAYEPGKGFKKISKQLGISHSIVQTIYKWKTFKITANVPR